MGVMSFAGGLIFLLAATSFSQGQPPALDGLPPNTERIDPLIPEGLRPDFILMKNEEGEAVLIPRTKYEEYERVLATTEASAEVPPSLEQLTIEVKTEGSIAKISAETRVVLPQANKKLLSVPLGLGAMQIIPPEGETPFPISVSPNGGGYLWRIPPGETLERKLSFQGVANIQTNSQSSSLRMVLPATTCTLLLNLPSGDWDVNTSGSESEVVEPIPNGGENSRFRIRASGGLLEVSWRRRASSDLAQATEGMSSTRYVVPANVHSASGNAIVASTRITLRGPKSLGGRNFTVTLPPGASWIEKPNEAALFSGYRLTKTTPPAAPDAPAENERKPETGLEIEIDESFANFEVEVPLEWEIPFSLDTSNLTFDNLRITGVERHLATLDIMLPQGRTLLWEPQDGVEYVKRANAPDASELLQYTFKVGNQGTLLKCRLLQQQSSPLIRSDYRVWLFPDRWILNGTIDFQDTTRNLPFLQLESRGWEVEQIHGGSTGREIPFTDAEDSETGNTVVPLSLTDLSEGNDGNAAANGLSSSVTSENSTSRRIQLRLVKRLAPDNDLQSHHKPPATLDFELPVLSWLDETSQTRQLWTPAASLQLFSSVASLEPLGLQEEKTGWAFSSAPISSTDQALKEARIYNPREGVPRFGIGLLVRGEGATFKGRFKPALLDSLFEATTTFRATANPEAWKLEQDWLLQVKGAYPTRLMIAIPKAWLDHAEEVPLTDALELYVNGTPITELSLLSEEESRNWESRFPLLRETSVWAQFSIPQSVYLTSTLDSAWLITLTPTRSIGREANKSERFEQPLAHLESTNERSPILVNSTVSLIQTRPDHRLLLNGKQVPKTQTEIQIGEDRWLQTRITLPNDQPLLDVTVVPDSNSISHLVSVERTWVQTVVKKSELRHRYVVRFKTSLPSITLQLPDEMGSDLSGILNDAECRLDETEPDSRIYKIDLTQAPPMAMGDEQRQDSLGRSPNPTYVLELFSWPTRNSGWLHEIEVPKIAIEKSNLDRAPLVWQLISARSDHLVKTSEVLSPNYRWEWSQFVFARKDMLSQSVMEQELGASQQPEIGEELNQYSLISLDTVQPCWVVFAPRFLIWTPIALATLSLTVLALRTSLLRHTLVWLIGIPVLFVLAFWSLDTTVLVAQSLVVALLVLLLFVIADWFLDRNARKKSVFAGRSGVGSTIPSPRPEVRSDSHPGSGSKSIATTIAAHANEAKATSNSKSKHPESEGAAP